MNGSLYEIISWFIVFIALFGAYLISNNDKRGFYLWVISNSFMVINGYITEQYFQVVLFSAYLLITINGILNNR